MTDPHVDLTTVAVSRYADACEPAALHMDCPFRVVVEANSPTCERECRDVILKLRRPGASRTHVVADQPFDAGQIRLSESSPMPDMGWHTASLMQVLQRGMLYRPTTRSGAPYLARTIDITSALAFLGRRGYDVERLVRDAFIDSLPSLITFWAAECLVAKAIGSGSNEARGWVGVLEETIGTLGANVTTGQILGLAQANDLHLVIRQWLATAPLEDIIEWRYTDTVAAPAADPEGTARWLIDRFTSTYLRDWASESLNHEYRHAKNPCDAAYALDLQNRLIARVDVAREIADRVVDGRGSRLEDVKSQALVLLQADRRTEAAALFDAVRILEPHNAEAHNNYGFCMSIDEPSTALAALRQSEQLEAVPFPINRINQAQVLVALGRDQEALAAAEKAHSQLGAFTGGAYLWTELGSEHPVAAYVDPIPVLLRLGQEVAGRAHDPDAASVWDERLATHAATARAPGADPS